MRLLSVVLLLALLTITSAAQQSLPARSVPDPGVIPTRQAISPAGVQAVFDARVHAVTFCGSDNELTAAVRGTIYRFDLASSAIVARHDLNGPVVGMQGMACVPQVGDVLLSVRQRGQHSLVRLPKIARSSNAPRPGEHATPATPADDWQSASTSAAAPAAGGIGALTVSGDGHTAVAVLTGVNEIEIYRLDEKKDALRVHMGLAPFAAAINRDGTVAWVSSWAGRLPKPGDKTAATGVEQPVPDRVVIDARGIAATGTVLRVDLRAGRVTNEVSVGLHPSALAWDEARGRLYVANGNSDSIAVLDTNNARTVATWPIQPFVQHVAGVSPTALALAPDGQRLYVTCGGINAVALLSTTSGAVEGLIPTGWYPSHIALSPNGKTLAVATLLGVGSGNITDERMLDAMRRERPDLEGGLTRRYVHAVRGTLHIITVPEPTQLAAYSRAVAENTRLPLRSRAAPLTVHTNGARPVAQPLPVPERQGDPSPIEHVIYIVKENRTYDQLFGDLDRGNGDPSLVLYGEDVTPNHRKLAREFVVLDNFYATGGDSGEGHQWVTQSNETDYVYWQGYSGRSYPFDGNDPVAYANGGFLWDAALKAGKTFADFGEFIPRAQFESPAAQKTPNSRQRLRADLLHQWKAGDDFADRFHVTSPIPPLDAHLVREFPSYGGESPDVIRARIFLRHLRAWEQKGEMPNLVYLQLPSDHTGGTSAGYSTPKACLADNDLALGQIVEGLTHSRFWPKMAIFVVEDDAQGGLDHVDGHRTIALAISPYVRRQSVDSTFYSHPSIAKTIELMLGLPHLSLFDLIANDMRNSFTSTPDLTPYTPVEPKQSLFEVNPPVQALKGQARRDALASARMDWSVPDAAPAQQLNRILWRKERGPKAKYPQPKHALFAPYSAPEADDDDQD